MPPTITGRELGALLVLLGGHCLDAQKRRSWVQSRWLRVIARNGGGVFDQIQRKIIREHLTAHWPGGVGCNGSTAPLWRRAWASVADGLPEPRPCPAAGPPQ